MSTMEVSNERATRTPVAAMSDLKLEVAVIPVSDVDRAKRFYGDLGWRLDADFAVGDAFRVVQFTPPGSPCSIHFGKGVTPAAPGSAREYLVVSDIAAARSELIGRGAAVGEVFHVAGPGQPPISGPDPERESYATYASFSDPDGNNWVLQEVNARIPGRGFSTPDVATLTELLQEAEKQHTQYEPTAPKHHWSGFYAAYVVSRQRGGSREEAMTDAVLQVERARRQD
jgi:catechol 2,3-dioxygenase-like lactoylglutathione lyase family enzyme